MKIVVNGTSEVFQGPLNIFELLKIKGLDPDKVVVEHNLEVVPTENFKSVPLNDDDRLEILYFVGGG